MAIETIQTRSQWYRNQLNDFVNSPSHNSINMLLYDREVHWIAKHYPTLNVSVTKDTNSNDSRILCRLSK